jgi:hypothetical protein
MRCKACNKKLLFPYWDKRAEAWETLCKECREEAEVPPTLEELLIEDGYIGVDRDNLD